MKCVTGRQNWDHALAKNALKWDKVGNLFFFEIKSEFSQKDLNWVVLLLGEKHFCPKK